MIAFAALSHEERGIKSETTVVRGGGGMRVLVKDWRDSTVSLVASEMNLRARGGLRCQQS